MGDLNAKVGKGKQGKVIGPFGLGEINESGEVWTDWCLSNEQVVINTWFNNHPRRLWTWRVPVKTRLTSSQSTNVSIVLYPIAEHTQALTVTVITIQSLQR